MGTGPRLEQIEGDDPTFRVEIDFPDGRTEIVRGAELLTSGEAVEISHRAWSERRQELSRVRVVNERSGFTRDTISRG